MPCTVAVEKLVNIVKEVTDRKVWRAGSAAKVEHAALIRMKDIQDGMKGAMARFRSGSDELFAEDRTDYFDGDIETFVRVSILLENSNILRKGPLLHPHEQDDIIYIHQ